MPCLPRFIVRASTRWDEKRPRRFLCFSRHPQIIENSRKMWNMSNSRKTLPTRTFSRPTYTLLRWGVASMFFDVSHETPDVTPRRTSPQMLFFVHVSHETPDVAPCRTTLPQGVTLIRAVQHATRTMDVRWVSTICLGIQGSFEEDLLKSWLVSISPQQGVAYSPRAGPR